MQLRLIRDTFTDRSTTGKLYIDDFWECFTLEDVPRETKIPGETAIPEGRYRVVINFSVRFQRMLPQLLDVPGFVGVRIHPGNTDADTEGCILVGQTRRPNWVGNSKLAFALLFAKLQTALRVDDVWIEITHAQVEAEKASNVVSTTA